MNTDSSGLNPQKVYQRRFETDLDFRRQMWRTLCQNYFQQFVPVDSVVLEIGAGYCEFINHIQAQVKIAVDINPDIVHFAGPDVRVFQNSTTNLTAVQDQSVTVVFMSNFLEHLSKPQIRATMDECSRVLQTGGRILILQPNIRFTYKDYWMFFDHITPIDDRAIVELLELLNFEITLLRPRFLPYTTKSRLPRSIPLLRIYLKFPILHRLFGGQAFIVGEKQHK